MITNPAGIIFFQLALLVGIALVSLHYRYKYEAIKKEYAKLEISIEDFYERVKDKLGNSQSVQKASCESLKSMNQSKVESMGMKDESTTYFLNKESSK